jgi:hypothetical protein
MGSPLEFYAPFTGFGDDPNASIKFAIDVTSGMPNWTRGGAKLATLQPQNSSDVITQYRGRDLRLLTIRIWFASRDDLEVMDGVQGRAATLRYHWNLTSRLNGTQEVYARIPYLTLPHTTLLTLEDQHTAPDGTAEAQATFRRPVGASSTYGYAVYSEDEE